MSAAESDENPGETTDPAFDPVAIRGRAVKLLARREHAAAELVDKLVTKGFDRDASATVVEDLAAENLQSETRYAEAMVADRARRGVGPNRIRADLAAAGCDTEAAEHALAGADVDWAELAMAAREKRFGTSLPRDFRERARQSRFLQRRGFDGEAVKNVLDD